MVLQLNKVSKDVALSILYVYLATASHHMYGAWLYETPWRNHIATQGLTWLLISYGFLFAYLKWSNLILKWTFVLFSGFFFIGAIGLYEGLYNHVLKNSLYFAGANRDWLLELYPAPKYHLPDDWIFEITGVLTFVISMWSLVTYVRFVLSKG